MNLFMEFVYFYSCLAKFVLNVTSQHFGTELELVKYKISIFQ